MDKYKFCILSFLTLLISQSCSCSKEEGKVYSPSEMWFKALDFDPTIELVGIPNHEASRRILCSQYHGSTGCVEGSGKRIKVRKVELITIQFEKEKEACLAAFGVSQWYARNWLFDDVTNEPVLESFIKKVFDAKRPKSEKDCS